MPVKKRGVIFIVSGPSGSGKTTLAQQILRDQELRDKITKSISYTTRPKRSGERSGRDYFFVSEAKFKQELAAKNILEWTNYLGYYYGTPRDFVDRRLKQGKSILLCVDLKGVRALRRFYHKDSVAIFILPPSIRELKKRIENRCNKVTKEEINRRLKLAKNEMSSAGKFDYRLMNKDLTSAVKQLKKIIINRIENEVAK